MVGEEEILVFDGDDLINGIGGALGLFLGWSILYLGKSRDILKYFPQGFISAKECYHLIPMFLNKYIRKEQRTGSRENYK